MTDNVYKDKERKPFEKLTHALEELWESQQFLDYLRFQSLVYHYSWNNRLLIWCQKPDAQLVFGFKKWQTMGRWVKKGEKAIGILIPVTFPTEDDDGKPTRAVRFMWKNCLFDISQTEGADLPVLEIPTLPVEGAEMMFHFMRDVSQNQFQVPVTMDPSRRGELGYYCKNGTINITEEFSTGIQALATITHELAHHLTPDIWTIANDEAEVIAEVAAYGVCMHFGVDIGDQAVPYIATWAKDKEKFLKGLPIAMDITAKVLDAIALEEGLEAVTTEAAAA